MTAVELIVAGLATYRISAMFVREAGPFDIFLKLRKAIGIGDEPERNTFLAGLFSCVWCMSVWVGLLCIVMALVSHWTFLLLLPFAASGIAVVLDSIGR